jgi:hypothetical protein
MIKSPFSKLFLTFLLIITCFSFSAYAQTESRGAIHRYLDIPFDNITTDEMLRVVMDDKGVSMDVQNNQLSFRASGIEDYGYKWNMYVDFNEDLTSINRISLSNAENGWGKDDEFRTLIERDILQFINVETQLIEKYGEPDVRFFYTDPSRYNLDGSTKFMFSSDQWSIEEMLDVCEDDKYLVAFSTWGNTKLCVWVDWMNEYTQGYLTRINLYFLSEANQNSSLSIVAYPPVAQP